MAATVVLAPAAAKDLDAIAVAIRAQVVADIELLAKRRARIPPGVKQLRGFKPPLYRLNSGDYRVLYRAVGEELHIYRVIDRKDLERALKRFR